MWQFPRHKAPIKCIHARQGIRASSAKVTAFFAHAEHENSVHAAYKWALEVAKKKQAAKNGISRYKQWICMHYSSRKRKRNFVGIFTADALKKLQSKTWYGNRKGLLSHAAKAPCVVYTFELSPQQNKLLFSDAYENPMKILSRVLYRHCWRRWNNEARRRAIKTAFDGWKSSDFILL